MDDEGTGNAYRDTVIAVAMRSRTPMGRWRPDPDQVLRFLNSGINVPNDPFLRMMLSLPEDWWPRTPQAVYDASAFSTHCAPLAELLGHYDFLSGSKGRWDLYLARFKFHRGLYLSTCLLEALDMVTMFETQVVGPAMRRLAIYDGDVVRPENPRLSHCIAARLLLGDKGLQAILDISDRWHRVHERIETSITPNFPQRYQWPAPFPDLVVPMDSLGSGNTLRIVGLTTPAELRAEGTHGSHDGSAGLGHCVASYWQKATTGESAILSVRLDLDGHVLRLSTIEVAFDGSGAMTVLQHRAKGNADPGGVAVLAHDWLVRSHADGTIRTVDAFRAHDWPTRDALDHFGYDWGDDTIFAAAVQAWSPLLSRNYRDPGAIERAVAVEAYAVVRARYPQGLDALRYGFLPPRTVPFWGQSPEIDMKVAGPTLFAKMFYGPRLARRLVRALPGFRRRGRLIPTLSEMCATLILSAVAVAAFLTGYRIDSDAGGTWDHDVLVGLLAGLAGYALSGYALHAVLLRLGARLQRELSGGTAHPAPGRLRPVAASAQELG